MKKKLTNTIRVSTHYVIGASNKEIASYRINKRIVIRINPLKFVGIKHRGRRSTLDCTREDNYELVHED